MKVLFLFFPVLVFSWAKPDTFDRHLNRVFVETGSFVGDGIEIALRAGFEEIYSVDVEESHIARCKTRFGDHPHVHLLVGSSADLLEEMIAPIQEPITFWLDAHNCGEPISGQVNNPILKELDAIKRHPIKTHTILIDDVRLFGTPYFDSISLHTLIRKLLEINPNYRISYQDGFVQRDILVARIVPLS